jgi:serine protease inhibitor
MTLIRSSKCLPVALVVVIACGDGINSIDELPRELSLAEQDLVAADNRFGFKIFREVVAQSDPNENIFISPMSIAMALGMTYNGARGSTRDSMQEVLELQGMDIQAINESYQSLIALLRDLDPKVEFAIANSIWYRTGLPVQQPFIDLNRTYFDAEVSALDFSDPSAAPTINRWVSENTNGRIEEIVENPIGRDLVMFLINAIYFKGDWTYQFDRSKTNQAPFRRVDGSTSTVDLMNSGQEMPLWLAYDGSNQIGELRYGGGPWRMTIVLPTAHDALPTVLDGLDEAQWNSWMASLDSTDMSVMLPKFTMEYEASLEDVLRALGMGIAFEQGQADLSGIGGQPGELFINQVKHKTFLEINEEGAEAAAATSVSIGTVSLPPSFRVDRPFFFVIREALSGSILFMGRIMDPGV